MALTRVHSSSICSRHSLIQFKVLHRLHFSKVKLARIFPNIDPLCDRCKLTPGTSYHMFWSFLNLFPSGLPFLKSSLMLITFHLLPWLLFLGGFLICSPCSHTEGHCLFLLIGQASDSILNGRLLLLLHTTTGFGTSCRTLSWKGSNLHQQFLQNLGPSNNICEQFTWSGTRSLNVYTRPLLVL